MFKFALLEDFRCPLCEDFGIVEVPVRRAFGAPPEADEEETEWHLCECRKNDALVAKSSGRPTP
jgi:hypothetical protein